MCDALTDCADPDCYAAEHCPSRSSSATLVHDAGTGLRWTIPRQSGGTVNGSTTSGLASAADCAFECAGDAACVGFLFHSGEPHSSSEVEFQPGACTTLDTLVETSTGVVGVQPGSWTSSRMMLVA